MIHSGFGTSEVGPTTTTPLIYQRPAKHVFLTVRPQDSLNNAYHTYDGAARAQAGPVGPAVFEGKQKRTRPRPTPSVLGPFIPFARKSNPTVDCLVAETFISGRCQPADAPVQGQRGSRAHVHIWLAHTCIAYIRVTWRSS